MKGRTVAEHSAEHPVDQEKEGEFMFPDEGLMELKEDMWKMYFDGAANQKGYGVGIILVSLEGAHTPFAIKLKYTSTNNTTEYEACILGLEAALNLGIEKLNVFGNSNLIISQARGDWRVKEERLKPSHEYLDCLRARFLRIAFFYLPREQNQLADSLANLASMIEIPVGVKLTPLMIEQKE